MCVRVLKRYSRFVKIPSRKSIHGPIALIFDLSGAHMQQLLIPVEHSSVQVETEGKGTHGRETGYTCEQDLSI